ncbi:MAG: hypothetical protein PHT16_00990 [Candidatus Pacebacteria bacterium]|nr:hypothetical protein [Candidatus Paceibacterota bacterium]
MEKYHKEKSKIERWSPQAEEIENSKREIKILANKLVVLEDEIKVLEDKMVGVKNKLKGIMPMSKTGKEKEFKTFNCHLREREDFIQKEIDNKTELMTLYNMEMEALGVWINGLRMDERVEDILFSAQESPSNLEN